jgi:CheY-like chemotaxis protein
MKVMILDDDPLILSLLVNIFHRRGYEIVTYSNPTVCPLYSIEASPGHKDEICPSVIISDYDMPFVNGVEFIETLHRKGCRCPHIALVSGSFPEQDNLDRVAKLGVKFFAKPLHGNLISDWLDQIETRLHSGAKPCLPVATDTVQSE